MRLFEAIMDANHRALAGDSRAGLHPSEFPDALPVVALTCADPRLNHLLPEVLGVREEDFIWLRNAGNIIFDPLSSMMRSLALACAVKGGKEIAVIGHTDCRVRQVSVNQLIESFRALGINRASLPDNLIEFFGLFASERQNVITGVSHIRQSPLISSKTPVHGLIVDIDSGRLEWLDNGYDHLGARVPVPPSLLQKMEHAQHTIGALADFQWSEMKLPEIKIGDLTLDPHKWLSELQVLKPAVQETDPARPPGQQAPPNPPPAQGQPVSQSIPIPPPIGRVGNFVRPKR